MFKRFLALAAFVALVGVCTHAFAAESSERPLNRAEAVALLVEANPSLQQRYAYFNEHMPPMPLFQDVPHDTWYAPYIEAAFEGGIITGNENALFRPADPITEEEMIALGVRYHSMAHPEIFMSLLAAEDQDWFTSLVNASLQSNMDLPFPIRLGQPIKRDDLFAMMTSMNVASPNMIAIQYSRTGYTRPIVVQQPVQQPRPIAQVIPPRPTTTSPAPTPPRPTTPTPTTPPPTAQPTVAAKPFSISMPTLGVKDLTITHPTDPFTKDGLHSVLKNGVGHLFSYPGKGGKILVYGHSSSYPWDVSSFTKIFRQINKLNVGDRITITYNGTIYTYEVTNKQSVPADDMSVYQQQGGGEELILYTCWPPDSIKERYLVHAKPVSAVAVVK